MYRFVKKKEKSVVFSLRLSTKKPPTLFFQPRPTLPIIPIPPPIINNYCNVQPPIIPTPPIIRDSRVSLFISIDGFWLCLNSVS